MTTTTPFENNHADPWAKAFVDLPELNASVTDAIVGAIAHVRGAARRRDAELRTSSLLVLGPAGAGKTHLFARLRRKLGPKAIFVHLRPLVGTDMTPRYVLGQIVQQLGYETETRGSDRSLKQLEALVGSSLAHLAGESPDLPRAFLDEVIGLDEAARSEKIDWAVERLLERHQEAEETYLTRLLLAPFMKPAQQRAALAWLAGRELEELQMQRLGVSGGLSEDRTIQALQTLGLFAAPGSPVVLVFDQLENLMDAEATGTRVRAYANLVAELFDATRGFVLVQMALDSEWEHAIRPQLSEAQKSRLGGHTLKIALPTPNQARELVRRWVEEMPNRVEPFPWPFGERRIEHWSQTVGLTPRMLMIECRQALAFGANAPFVEPAPVVAPQPGAAPDNVHLESDDAPLMAAWESHLAAARVALDEAVADRRSADPARLVGGMACCLRFVKDAQTSRVDARQHVQLIARVGPNTCFVVFLHQTHPRSAATALDRASECLAKGRALAVREQALEFAPTWKKVQASLSSLVEKGLRWISLERDDAARLLALESLLAAAKSKDLEDDSGRIFKDAEVHDWIERTLGVAGWPLVRAVTGARVEREWDGDAVAPQGSLQGHKSAAASVTGNGEHLGSDTATTIRACLAQLRIASLERLVREVSRVKPEASRAEIVSALEAMSDWVRWFGRAIVAVREQEAR
jgi:AAA domain